MAIKIDFLFIYELKVRELESICLLKYELERRGYTVAFINTWHSLTHKTPKYEARVVVAHALYNDALVNFISSYVNKINKVINMQWEQIVTNLDEQSNETCRFISGSAKSAVHLSWGEKNKNKLIKDCGIPAANVKLTGNITLDFLRREFSKYYLSRYELFIKYKIPIHKKICLFISSFSYVDLPKRFAKDDNLKLANDPDIFIEISRASQSAILDWLEKILIKNEEIVFIYRPHPAEATNKKLINLSNKYPNFLIINDLSVKQWIKTVDLIYTWYSTSLVEVYCCNKPCFILRPIEIPYNLELTICSEAKFISNFNEFEKTLYQKKTEFPLQESALLSYCNIDTTKPSYIKICDVMEEVYKNDCYVFPTLKKNKRNATFSVQNLKQVVGQSFIYDALEYVASNTNLNLGILNRIRLRKVNNIDTYTLQQQYKNYVTNDEINNMVRKIKNIISNYPNI